MKILYLCHRLPYPPKYGSQVRSFNVIQHLHAQGHQITVATPARSAQEVQEAMALKNYCLNCYVGRVDVLWAWMRMFSLLLTSRPSSEGYFYSSSLHRQIRQTLAEIHYDLIFVHCSSVAQYVENVSGIPKILDFTDMDSQKWLIYSRVRHFPLSWEYWIEGTKLQRKEALLARKFDVCTCATQAELATLVGYGTGAQADWFPNGVDTEYFHVSERPYDPNTISFVGRMDYYPNQEGMTTFCRTTLPLLKARRPQIKLLIVGANPPVAIRRLAEIPGVTVTGYVPDVRPYVQGSALTVAPLQIARGTQNKVLESMAMGVPAVVSEQVATGVDAVPGKHLLTAIDPADFCEAILNLIKDTSKRERLSRAARERVLSHHTWQGAMNRLDGIIASCLKS